MSGKGRKSPLPLPLSPETILTNARVISKLDVHTLRLSFLRNGHQCLGHIPMKLRHDLEDLSPGDLVRVEMTPYDMDKAKIVAKLPPFPEEL